MRTYKKLTDIQKKEAVRLYTAGEQSARSIARYLSVSPNNIRDALLKNGVSLDKGRHYIAKAAKGRPSGAAGRVRGADEIARQISTRKANNKPCRSGYKHSAETRAKISAGVKAKNLRHTRGIA